MNKYFVYVLAIIGILFTACSQHDEPFYKAPEKDKSYRNELDESKVKVANFLAVPMTNRSSYTINKGRESLEFVLDIPNTFGFPTLVIENSNSSSEDLRYVIYMKKTGSSSWTKYTSNFWDIDPGDRKEIKFNMNQLNYDMSQTKIQLINGGWSGSNTPVYANVHWK